MSYLSRRSCRQDLAFAFAALAIAITACSANSASTPPSLQNLPKNLPQPLPTAGNWVLTPIIYPISNSDTMVTGITDKDHIIGAYGSSSGSFDSYTADCQEVFSGGQEALSCPSPVPHNYKTLSTYMSGVDSADNQVGWVNLSSTSGEVCRTCGFSRISSGSVRKNSGSASGCFDKTTEGSYTWCLFSDPSQGTNSCAVTELLGLNSASEFVGYYEKNGAGCPTQAFEAYAASSSGSGTYFYYDLNPATALTSVATGVDDSGDVVGTMTTSSGTEGWLYHFESYKVLQCYIGGAYRQTHPIGVSGIDDFRIVGYYVQDGFKHGFYVPNGGNPSCQKVDYPGAADTVLTGINNHQDISGYAVSNSASSAVFGFVGYCNLNQGSCCGTATSGGNCTSDRSSPSGLLQRQRRHHG